MPLIHRMVAPSFRQVASNIKALSAKGWVECNSILIDNPYVQRDAARTQYAQGRAATAAALEAPTASAAVVPEAPMTLALVKHW